jgi:cysteine synthase A
VEPESSPLVSKGVSGAHGIQGIGANFIPKNLDLSVIDKVMTVKTVDAYYMAKTLARTEGILSGISSGASLSVANLIATQEENKDKAIVVILPDTGERYLSTELFTD